MALPASSQPGLYVHVPFCSTICPYCDFAVTRGGQARQDVFVAALLQEIEGVPLDRAPWSRNPTFDSIYIGGGTPSYLAIDSIRRILSELGSKFSFADNLESNLEANPEDVTWERLEAWAELGVTRLSLGIQSFDDGELRFLGRRHDSGAAARAVERATRAGLQVSLDLIYGLPDQTIEGWRRNLAHAIALEPDHISCYQLTIERGTPFARRRQRGELVARSTDDQADFLLETHRILTGAGYEGYEVSNFARRLDAQSRHNQKYWNHVPYLGLGPSAHSFDGRDRWWNERSEAAWREKITSGENPRSGSETLEPEQLALEMLMLGLRQKTGVDLAQIEDSVDLAIFSTNDSLLSELECRNWAHVENGRLVPTVNGMARADGIARRFVL